MQLESLIFKAQSTAKTQKEAQWMKSPWCKRVTLLRRMKLLLTYSNIKKKKEKKKKRDSLTVQSSSALSCVGEPNREKHPVFVTVLSPQLMKDQVAKYTSSFAWRGPHRLSSQLLF